MDFDGKFFIAILLIIAATILFAMGKIDFTQYTSLLTIALGLITANFAYKTYILTKNSQ